MLQADKIRAHHAAEGGTVSEIAERLGCSRAAVYSALKHSAPRGRPRQHARCKACGQALPSAGRHA